MRLYHAGIILTDQSSFKKALTTGNLPLNRIEEMTSSASSVYLTPTDATRNPRWKKEVSRLAFDPR
jgi:hypothetical protein